MALTLQDLLSDIINRTETLDLRIDDLDLTDISITKDKHLNKIHYLEDKSSDAPVKKIAITSLIKLLYVYGHNDNANAVLKKFQSLLSNIEIRKILRYQVKYHCWDRDIRGLPFVVTRIQNKEEFDSAKAHGWRPSIALLLDNFCNLPEDILLKILRRDRYLLNTLSKGEELAPLISIDLSIRGNLFHFAVLNNRVKLLNFLLRYTPGLAVDYTHNEVNYPYWLLVRDNQIFNLLLKSTKQNHRDVQMTYCLAHITGLVSQVPMVAYEAMLKNRSKSMFVIRKIEDNYNLFASCTHVIEAILASADEEFLQRIRFWLTDSAMTLLILNNALVNQNPTLIELIASCYTKYPFELLCYLATYSDIEPFQTALLRFNKFPYLAERLLNVFLSARFNKPLLVLLETAPSLLSEYDFTTQIFQYKNPLILLKALQLGFECTYVVVLETAAFALLMGDKNTAIALLNYTDYCNEQSWIDFMHSEPVIQPISPLLADTPSNVCNAYGLGLSQKDYADYQQYQTALLFYHFLTKRWSFASFKPDPSSWNVTWALLGEMRHNAALLARSRSKEYFGVHRDCELITPLRDTYAVWRDKIHNNYACDPARVKNAYYNFDAKGIVVQGQIQHEIDDKSHSLTIYELSERRAVWKHTPPTELNCLGKKIHTLIQAFNQDHLGLNQRTETQEVTIRRVALIHWYLAHATPYIRGSASISECVAAALMLLAGYTITFREAADCAALASPNPRPFVDSYSSFFSLKSLSPDNVRGCSILRKLEFGC